MEKERKVKLYIIVLGIVVVFIGVGIFYWYSKKINQKYNTYTVKPITLVEKLDISGGIESEYDVTLKSSVSGTIIERFINENDFVKKNQILFKLDTIQAELQLNQAITNANASKLQAETELKNAQKSLSDAIERKKININNLKNQIKKVEENVSFLEKELERNYNLFKENAVTKQNIDNLNQQLKQAKIDLKIAKDNLDKLEKDNLEILNAQNRINTAKATLDNSIKQGEVAIKIAKDNLERMIIKSPVNATVSNIKVNKGDYLVPNTPLCRLQDLNNIHLRLPVNELDIPKIKINDKVIIVFDAFPDEKYEGKVYRINKSSISDLANLQVFPVYVKLNKKVDKIKPGMSADANIIVSEKRNTIAVPINSIQKKEDKIFVKILKEKNKIEEVEVKIGITTLDYVEILSGVKEGDNVIIDEIKK
ncbi:MAG: secretion protein HlyD [Candidatus Sericytochromatia bacterium]|nr:MAG: secretion protein HlyD [Candidatus Sericytochromatia bacterium]